MTKNVRPPDWTSWQEARRQMPEIYADWYWPGWRGDEALIRAFQRGVIRHRHGGCGDQFCHGREEVPLKKVLEGLQKLTFLGSEVVIAEYEVIKVTQSFSVLGGGSLRTMWPMTWEHRSTATVWIRCPELVWSDLRSDLIERELPAGAAPSGSKPKKPGPKRNLRDYIKQTLLAQLTRGELTVEALNAYTFEQLGKDFFCSPNTADAARKEAISEFLSLNNSEY